jgi:hypothetical protein
MALRRSVVEPEHPVLLVSLVPSLWKRTSNMGVRTSDSNNSRLCHCA